MGGQPLPDWGGYHPTKQVKMKMNQSITPAASGPPMKGEQKGDIMAAYHMYFVDRTQFDYIRTLFGSSVDGQYIVLSSDGDYTDIAQYSARYDTIKFVSVPTERLRRSDELVIRETK